MKHFLSYNQILENLAQAKAILRKNNLDQNDDKFQQLLKITNKDGYTGIFTKYAYQYGADIAELRDLYTTIKDKSINVADIISLSYDDAVDFVFADELSEGNDIVYMFSHNGYKVFRVKSYDAGLEINSPAWCLKTKSHYVTYTTTKKGKNIVAIKDEYIQKGVIKLPTPDTFFGSYSNPIKPTIRYGITIYPSGRYDFFDDNNKTTPTEVKVVDMLVEKAKAWLMDNDDFDITPVSEEFDELRDYIIDYNINRNVYGSFDMSFYTEDKETTLRDINSLLNSVVVNNKTVRQLMLDYADEVLGCDDFTASDGFTDAVLYSVFEGNDAVLLSGMKLNERFQYDKCLKYAYGFHKYYWGRKYILQSYGSIDAYFQDLIEQPEILFGVIDDDLGCSVTNADMSDVDSIRDYTKTRVLDNGYALDFFVDKFSRVSDIDKDDVVACALRTYGESISYENGILTLILDYMTEE